MKADPSVASFQVEFHRQPSGVRVAFRGFINESTQLPINHRDLAFPLDIDLSGVTLINSMGLRTWMLFIVDVSKRGPVTLHRVPEVMVRQFCMVAGSHGGAVVRSVLAPYRCDACGAASTQELTIGVDVVPATYSKPPPRKPCARCAAPSSFDDIADAFFSFTLATP